MTSYNPKRYYIELLNSDGNPYARREYWGAFGITRSAAKAYFMSKDDADAESARLVKSSQRCTVHAVRVRTKGGEK